MSATPEVLAEYDAIEQRVEDGDLCSVDGEPHDWESIREEYGADRDGNRGVWYTYKACRKCGEEA